MCFIGLSEITLTNFPVTEKLFKELFLPPTYRMRCPSWIKAKKIVKKLDENIKKEGRGYVVKIKFDIIWLQKEIVEMKFPETKLFQQKNLITTLGIILADNGISITIKPPTSKESFADQTGF